MGMNDHEQQTITGLFLQFVEFKSDIKDHLRDLKTEIAEQKQVFKTEISELKTIVKELNTTINDFFDDDDSKETIIDRAMGLAETNPELANKMMDKFGDKIGLFLDNWAKNE